MNVRCAAASSNVHENACQTLQAVGRAEPQNLRQPACSYLQFLLKRHSCRLFANQVVGRAEPHNLRLGHPEQKRVMTIRENARVQVRRRVFRLCVTAAGRELRAAQVPSN